MKYKQLKHIEPIYELLERLYFTEGLEDIRFLHHIKHKYLKEWCEKQGEKICRIIYALLMEKDPEYISQILDGGKTKSSK